MTETMLAALDQQMTASGEIQKSKNPLTDNALTHGQIGNRDSIRDIETRSQATCDSQNMYPDLYLPVAENYRISN